MSYALHGRGVGHAGRRRPWAVGSPGPHHDAHSAEGRRRGEDDPGRLRRDLDARADRTRSPGSIPPEKSSRGEAVTVVG